MYKDIARVVRHETIHGTYFVAQRYVPKTYWFKKNDCVWEYFSIRKNDTYGNYYFQKLEIWDLEDNTFLDSSVAEYYCETWARVNSSGKPIKIWSIGE